MNRTLADIIFSSIIGDAAGYTFTGMKKAHIKAIFREITGFTDPAPALKDNMYRWKKPGLYSSISVNTLLTAACTDKRGINLNDYIKAVKNSPEVSGTESGIFRDAGEAEKNFIFRVKNGENSEHHYNHPCSRLLPAVLPLLLIKNEKDRLISAVNFISLFTKSSSTIACSLLLLQLIEDLIAEKDLKILKTALISAEKTKEDIISSQNRIFDSGHNPDYILSASDSLLKLFRELNDIKDSSQYEKIICAYTDSKKTGLITRASINLPETILPMAVVLSDLCSDPERIIETAVREGGASSSLTAISAALTTAHSGVQMPEIYTGSIVNKKRLSAVIDLIAEDKNRAVIISEIYAAEPGLTAKEIEEHRAKTKNIPVSKEKKVKSRGEMESVLSKHVVESWTKMDKAKWKKERNK